MNKYWKLISNTLIFAIGTFSSKVLVFLLMPLYTSVLSEAEYGTVDLMVQVGNFLLPLVSCGIINGIIRFGLDKYYKKSDVFTTGFLTILGGFGILLVLEPLLCHISYLGDNTMMIYVFVLMSSMRSLCSQFVRAKGYVKLYALDGILSTATTIFFNVLYLVVLKWGINGYILAMISADTLSTLFLFYLAGLAPVSAPAWIGPAHLQRDAAILDSFDSQFHLLVDQQHGKPLSDCLFSGHHRKRSVCRRLQNPDGHRADVQYLHGRLADVRCQRRPQKTGAQFFTRVFVCYQALLCTAASGLILFSKVITKVLVADSYYISWKYIPLLLISTIFSCMSTFLGSVYMVEKKICSTSSQPVQALCSTFCSTSSLSLSFRSTALHLPL